MEETLDDIIKLAEGDDGEGDPGHDLFDHYPESEDEGDEDEDTEQGRSHLLLPFTVHRHIFDI